MDLAQILVLYHSGEGTTRRLAEALHNAALAAGAQSQCCDLSDPHKAMALLDQCDAVALGSPTYMGMVAQEFLAFGAHTSERWSEQRWRDKIACGFTCGANANGDQSSTLTYMQTFACQHGMLWLSLDIPGQLHPEGLNRFGTSLGATGKTVDGVVHPLDLGTAAYLGKRLASACLRWKRGA